MPTIGEVLEKADEQPQWICDPYIARQGITFLHGKTSIGKSPVTWEIARTANQGLDFFGCPTVKSRVLYIEADGPEILLRSRLRLLPAPIGDWRIEFLSGQSLNLCEDAHAMFDRFKRWQTAWNPDLVVWNTLRQFYKGTAIDGDIVARVYNAMQRSFPNAGHIVSAHDRKLSTSKDAVLAEDEDFSGSAAWRDLATIALHLIPRGDQSTGRYLSLEHTKSQVSEKVAPLKLILDPDGTTLTHSLHPLTQRVLDLCGGQFPSPGGYARSPVSLSQDTVRRTMSELNISRATVYRILKASQASQSHSLKI